ncbi:MAG: hypothetical protein EZS28_035842, partial [Streblomastix strix]
DQNSLLERIAVKGISFPLKTFISPISSSSSPSPPDIQPNGWIRKLSIVKERGRRPWCVQQERQRGKGTSMIRNFHLFELYEGEVCRQKAISQTVGIVSLKDGIPLDEKDYKWDGNKGKNYGRFPENVIRRLYNLINILKNEVQQQIEKLENGDIDEEQAEEDNEEEEEEEDNEEEEEMEKLKQKLNKNILQRSQYRIRLFGFHTLDEAQECFRVEFYDTIGEIFPVQSGQASEDEADEAFL